MTTPTPMTLPPCPIAGHDNPHHFHLRHDDALGQRPATPGHPKCAHSDEYASRCYSAHVPTEAPASLEVAADAPSPDHDEWVRVPVGTVLPPETAVLTEYVTRESTRVMAVDACHGGTFYVTRSDLDAILKPAPTPAEKLAEALAAADPDASSWCADDVLAALDTAGLELAERGEK